MNVCVLVVTWYSIVLTAAASTLAGSTSPSSKSKKNKERDRERSDREKDRDRSKDREKRSRTPTPTSCIDHSSVSVPTVQDWRSETSLTDVDNESLPIVPDKCR